MTAGSTLRFETEHVEGGFFEGQVVEADPPRTLEFSWGTDVIRFEIEPTGDGSLLMLFDTIDEVGKAARDAAGWHVCLDKLELHLDGKSPDWADSERWQELHGDYVSSLGPEASTIGPPGVA